MLKKIVHIVIASLILVSTLGFTINLHYCYDQLYDTALFSPANSCCDASNEGHCHVAEGISDMNHCEDESISAEPGDDFIVSSYSFNFESFHFSDLNYTFAILPHFQDSNNNIALEAPWFKKPPLIQEVVLSQIQSFLI